MTAQVVLNGLVTGMVVALPAVALTLIYGLVKREPVIIIGQLVSNIIYVRNLMLIFKSRAAGSETLDH